MGKTKKDLSNVVHAVASPLIVRRHCSSEMDRATDGILEVPRSVDAKPNNIVRGRHNRPRSRQS